MTNLLSRLPEWKNPFASDSPLVSTLIAITLLLTFSGLFMVFSASSVSSGLETGGNFVASAFTQSSIAFAGGIIALIISRFRITFWQRFRNLFVLIGIALQMAVLFYGQAYGGNQNWIRIGSFSIQPSEFLKLAIIVWFASWIHDNDFLIDRPLKYWRQPLYWVVFPIGLVVLGGDLGTSMVLGLIVLGMLGFAGVPARIIGTLAGIGLAGALIIMNIGGSGRGSRVSSWLQGCSIDQYEDVCWQTMHGLWALSSGGLFGLGPGSSRAKWSWLPHADSDYIFAIVGEELGMLGAIGLIVLFLALAVTLVRLIREFPQTLTRVLIGGVLVWIVGQAFVNIAVVLNLLPVLGVPLPFVSSGGSALFANLLAVGVVISCVRYEEQYG